MADSTETHELGFRPLDLTTAPGHLIRRAQQIHTRVWAVRVDGTLTSPQFAVLTALAEGDALDQATIGEMISLDRSTMADVAQRLESRGWLTRGRDPSDARRRVLELTPAGRRLLARVTPLVEQLGDELLGDLSESERQTLVELLGRLIVYGEQEPE
jgi:DNA-binding MarR family transcriptional regulator